MKVSLKTCAPLLAVGTMALSSCYNTPTSNMKKYMMETNRTQAELNQLTKGLSSNNVKDLTVAQSRLDSMAYRDLFNTTSAAKDSTKVANFNKIAARYRADFDQNTSFYEYGQNMDTKYDKPILSIVDKLTNANISVKELEDIKAKTKEQTVSDDIKLYYLQHFADDWAYRKYFQKIGIYKDGMAEKCDELSEQLKPYKRL